MVRLIAIALLIALAFVLIRYRTNEKLPLSSFWRPLSPIRPS